MQVVKDALKILEENQSEWSTRWSGYAEKIHSCRSSIVERRKLFNEWAPLRIYMPVGAMVKKNSTEFSLRYHGADVAQIIVDNIREPRLVLKEWTKKGETHHHSFEKRKTFGVNISPGNYSWDSAEAKEIRSDFKKYDEKFEKSSEHQLESLIIDELESKVKSSKFQGTLHNIRPVELADKIRFQMAVPLKGNAGVPTYPKKSRGNIDILARIKVGGRQTLPFWN